MDPNWTTVALFALLLLLNIISFCTYLVQREAKEQAKPHEIIQIRNGPATPIDIRQQFENRVEPKFLVLDRGRRIIYRNQDFQRVNLGEVVAKWYGSSIFVNMPDGGEQEYLKPCGCFVTGGFGNLFSTFCVLPDDHRYKKHVDVNGNTKKIEEV